jgi:hypothetical protein
MDFIIMITLNCKVVVRKREGFKERKTKATFYKL